MIHRELASSGKGDAQWRWGCRKWFAQEIPCELTSRTARKEGRHWDCGLILCTRVAESQAFFPLDPLPVTRLLWGWWHQTRFAGSDLLLPSSTLRFGTNIWRMLAGGRGLSCLTASAPGPDCWFAWMVRHLSSFLILYNKAFVHCVQNGRHQLSLKCIHLCSCVSEFSLYFKVQWEHYTTSHSQWRWEQSRRGGGESPTAEI